MDLNNDGIKDVIHGGGGGPCQLYYGNSHGTVKKMGPLQVGGKDLHLYYYSFYEVTDWNEDGLWDLIAFGAKEQTITLYINEGTKEQYLFNSELVTKSEGGVGFPELSPTRVCPVVVDFDYDGKKDLLLGNSNGGGLKFYKNVGSNSSPEFDYSSGITVTNDAGEHWTDSKLEVKVDIADLNGDGLLDIIVGGAGGGKPTTEQYLYISYGYGETANNNQVSFINNDNNISIKRAKSGYTISNISGNNVTFSVFNMKGTTINSNVKLDAKKSITLNNLNGGIFYLVKFKSSSQKITRKIMAID